MESTSFLTLDDQDLYSIEGGSTAGNVLIAAGAVVALTATGPVAVGVGIGLATLGFVHSQNW